jgi:hypothetical protein
VDIEAWMIGARDEESVIESISGRWERKGEHTHCYGVLSFNIIWAY